MTKKKRRHFKLTRAKPDDPIFKQGLVIYTPMSAPAYREQSALLGRDSHNLLDIRHAACPHNRAW